MTDRTSDNIVNIALTGFILGIVVLSVALLHTLYRDAVHPRVCTGQVEVAEIIRVSYRDSTYIDENGDEHVVNQGSYKVGDKMCISWGRQ